MNKNMRTLLNKIKLIWNKVRNILKNTIMKFNFPIIDVAEIEEEIRRVREGLSAGLVCLGCGEVNKKGSYFCGQCGAQLP